VLTSTSTSSAILELRKPRDDTRMIFKIFWNEDIHVHGGPNITVQPAPNAFGVRSLMALAMLFNQSLRLPLRQVIPSLRLENETAFAMKWPHNRKLAIQSCTQCMKFLRRLRCLAMANNFRLHLAC